MKGQEIVGVTGKQNLSHTKLHSVEVYPFGCREITFQEISAA
jgi:hypothetical protein